LGVLFDGNYPEKRQQENQPTAFFHGPTVP
jgi:hypothetical protein